LYRNGSVLCRLAVAIAEDHGKWELEQRRSFTFTLSYTDCLYDYHI